MSLTPAEIDELDMLLEMQRIDRLIQNLNVPSKDKNPNYLFLLKAILKQRYNKKDELVDGFAGVILEGSSRSGKTWSSVDIIIWLCLHIETNCKINIYRETFAEFKDTIADDFKRRLDDYDLPNPFHTNQNVRSFKIGRNKISFKGCDKLGKTHGAGADYVFFNEMITVPKNVFDQAEMRCRKFWWGDYNPSVTQHYIFSKILTRDNVGFLRTTFLDNPHITPGEKNKILASEPWEPGSYYVEDEVLMYNGFPITDDNQPPIHKFNERNATIDEHYWKVYGLGLRGAMEGVIFPNVFWIDEFPDIAHTYSNDFGFTTDPNVTGRYAEDEHNIWIECLTYEPIETPEQLHDTWLSLGIPMEGTPICCDSSDKFVKEGRGTIEMVLDLQNMGWEDCYKISKTRSIMFWILSMKQKKIHIVKNEYYEQVKAEQENYVMKEIHGILVNQPIDKWNHFWDMARYGHISHNSKLEVLTEWS